ncbi:MAG: hypothetical protein A3K67_02705 [Euryarchaeota archaeon RBG_16_62_10]|nr:MAG: hypothetical protein A3K67_02705 [Euryarchaeota archaeon RBG_16_62_10]
MCRRLSSSDPAGRRSLERSGDSRRARKVNGLQESLDLAGLGLGAGEVLSAARNASAIAVCCGLAVAASVFVVFGSALLVPTILGAAAVPFLVHEIIVAFPDSAVRRRATDLLRSSPSATNLMIMSLRLEPSVSKAIGFASKGGSAFSRELRKCVWGVVMGRYASFEEALHDLGTKWSKHSGELKTSMNALVTASRESTEEGRRRALDRANDAMVQGAKRRIEDYALSLSTPSMVMFGLGILLPLMVGSFLPMLSWDAWGTDQEVSGAPAYDPGPALLQMVFLMNVLFPAIALVVALGATSRHPTRAAARAGERRGRRSPAKAALLPAAAALAFGALAVSLEGELRYLSALAGAVAPVSLWLLSTGVPSQTNEDRAGLEDALFRAGGRMVEGENFESSIWKVGRDTPGQPGNEVRRLSLGRVSGPGVSGNDQPDGPAGQNAREALRIVQLAAGKDERAAGLLAMDLAAYLRDLKDLETSLTARVRPTISMMKTTAHVLAPVVLGVTYAMYLALGSIAGDGAAIDPGLFFLVLGVFLMETDAAVMYFVWGIEGLGDHGRLARSTGTCLLTSMAVYTASALIAS